MDLPPPVAVFWIGALLSVSLQSERRVLQHQAENVGWICYVALSSLGFANFPKTVWAVPHVQLQAVRTVSGILQRIPDPLERASMVVDHETGAPSSLVVAPDAEGTRGLITGVVDLPIPPDGHIPLDEGRWLQVTVLAPSYRSACFGVACGQYATLIGLTAKAARVVRRDNPHLDRFVAVRPQRLCGSAFFLASSFICRAL